MTGKFVDKAKRELMNGSSDVSVRFRETRDQRKQKAGTGGVQQFTEEEQARYQTIVDYAN